MASSKTTTTIIIAASAGGGAALLLLCIGVWIVAARRKLRKQQLAVSGESGPKDPSGKPAGGAPDASPPSSDGGDALVDVELGGRGGGKGGRGGKGQQQQLMGPAPKNLSAVLKSCDSDPEPSPWYSAAASPYMDPPEEGEEEGEVGQSGALAAAAKGGSKQKGKQDGQAALAEAGLAGSVPSVTTPRFGARSNWES